MRPDLSILVCSTDTRYATFAVRLLDELFRQARAHRGRVEVVCMTDTKSMSIGAKRNALVGAASGRYVQFVDDDDRVADTMVREVLDATEQCADVICFPVQVSLSGGPPRICRYSMTYGWDHNTPHEFRRIPNHICAVKRELATATPYADICMGEDAEYARRLLPKLETEYQVSQDKPLYFYDYNPATSECRR